MKAPKPIPPTEKLPKTYHITMVREIDRGERWWSIVITEQQGDKILRRKVVETIESRQLALDEFMRTATRLFYFDEGADYMERA